MKRGVEDMHQLIPQEDCLPDHLLYLLTLPPWLAMRAFASHEVVCSEEGEEQSQLVAHDEISLAWPAYEARDVGAAKA